MPAKEDIIDIQDSEPVIYEKTEWKPGDKVTSAKLNKIEEGINNLSPMVVEVRQFYTTINNKNYTIKYLDITAQELLEAFHQGRKILLQSTEELKDRTVTLMHLLVGYAWQHPINQIQTPIQFLSSDNDFIADQLDHKLYSPIELEEYSTEVYQAIEEYETGAGDVNAQ